MSGLPWVKWFPGDFLNGIAALEPNEIAVYVVVLNRIYDESGPIADDIVAISRRCNMRPSSCQKALNALFEAGKLVLSEGLITNVRAEKEIKSRQKVSDKSTISIRTRWMNEREKRNEINETAIRPYYERITDVIPTRSQKLEPEEESPTLEIISDGGGSDVIAIRSPPPGKEYAFEGEFIRLNQRDYDRMKNQFADIVMAVGTLHIDLTVADAYLRDHPKSRDGWFAFCTRWLKTANEEYRLKRNAASKPRDRSF